MHESCSLCFTVPETCGAYWKGNELQGEPLPEAIASFEVVGAPFVKAHTSSNNTTILRCPECGTCYRRVFEYDYMPNGNEDDIEITRLGRDEARQAVKEVERTVAEAHEEFTRLAKAHLALLRKKPLDPTVMNKVGDYFYFRASIDGFDISFALEDFMASFLAHEHPSEGLCPAWYLKGCIEQVAEADSTIRDELRERLSALDLSQLPVDIGSLVHNLTHSAHLAALRLPSTSTLSALDEAVRFFFADIEKRGNKGAVPLLPDFVNALRHHPHPPEGDCPGDLIARILEGLVERDEALRGQILELLEPDPSDLSEPPEIEALASALRSAGEQILPANVLSVSKVSSVAWSPDGERVLTGSESRQLTLWNRTGEVDAEWAETTSYPPRYIVQWHPSGQSFATGDNNGSVKFWEVHPGTPPAIKRRDKERRGFLGTWVVGLAWNTTGSRLAVWSPGPLQLWSEEGQLIHEAITDNSRLLGVNWAPDGTRLATTGLGGAPKLWDSDGGSIATLGKRPSGFNWPTWMPDSQSLVTWGEGAEKTEIWTLDGTALASLTASVRIAVSSRGQLAVVPNDEQTRVLLSERDGTHVASLSFATRAQRVAWAEGGELLAIALESGDVVFCNRAGETAARVPGNGAFAGLRWSPDGCRLAVVVGFGKLVRIVDELNREAPPRVRTLALEGKTEPLSWSGDSRGLFAGGWEDGGQSAIFEVV